MASKGESDTQSGQSDQQVADLEDEIYSEHHSIPDSLRQDILSRDDHRCQINGCCGRARNGSAQLLVQQIDKDQFNDSDHNPADLETRCLRCSVWIAQMPTTDDLRPRVKQRLSGVTLEPTRAEILQYLAEKGPATTGEILENVNLSSKPGVRQALYSLMGLDVREPEIDQRIVVKNRDDQTYGLPWQVPDEYVARGYIPVRPAELRNRILDELVCRLYRHLDGDIENTQDVIAEIVERNPQQIQHMRRRGEAFQFPFGRWADREESREDPSAIIASVDALASETNNLSRQLLSRNIANVYESNDEQLLADMLRAWAESKDISPYVDQRQTNTENTDEESLETDGVSSGTMNHEDQSDIRSVEYDSPDKSEPQSDLRVLEPADTGEQTTSGGSDDFGCDRPGDKQNDDENNG